ncbi:universal stress protein [Hymenobacter antarcticus]|uniref:UspA domain-containing protein n=1 Tax=Hymenobacter antarcticus TaxID=486270 RepID=A0ABP7R2V3_9BACT
MKPSIVVLTDFFAVTNRALSYAAGLAVPLKASLLLLHARHDELLAPEEFASRHTAEGEQKTVYALEKLAAAQPVATAVDISNFSLAEAVREVVGQCPPLLVVLGRAGAEPAPEDLVTATAMDLLGHTPYPLLVIPPAGWDAFPPRRLLLAVDGEPFSLVEYRDVLSQLLLATHGTLSLVRVTANGETAPSAAAVLDTVRPNDLVNELAEGSLRQVYQNTVVGGVLQEAADQQADMLVIIARRHSLIGGLFHRSVTAQLLRESVIPVLVLPAAD